MYYLDPRADIERSNAEDVVSGFISTTRTAETVTLETAIRHSQHAWLITSQSIFAKDTIDVAAMIKARGQLVKHWQVYEITIELYALEDLGP